MLADVVDLLACPYCSQPLEQLGRTLRCGSGHSFDVAKQGYVNLLTRPAGANADTVAMVADRITFLDTGAYAPIAAAIAAHTRGAAVIVDAGAGTGYYLDHALPTGARGVACDISVAAAKRAAKLDRIGAVVADTWAGLPVRSDCADVVLCVFAPRNMAEFARLLRPSGHLIVVTPSQQHLASVRARHKLIEVEPDKLGRLDAAAEPHLTLQSRERVEYAFDASAEQVGHLIGMGPNALHTHAAARPGTVEVSVEVSVFGRH
ncbi:putative RNA methyltransferase [Granulicoccus phenolivorans]|uniref:putative RNA methyltransferase n=1 Tax=Granulicoccus phenolivorans TaxID=266854 RepID=UPI00041EB2FA|nr:methyltransferase domain-containing protein [Granulicoccus phenolivorans]